MALIRDNLAWPAFVAALFVLLSPYQIWKLLTNNRPARGTGWKMWLADRYIQIWLARGSTDSSDIGSELCTPLGTPDTMMRRVISRKTMDEQLEKYWLVRRVGSTVSARRELHLFVCNWLTYLVCRWYLTFFWGDTKKYYEEIATPPSKFNKAVSDTVMELSRKALAIVAYFALLFLLLRVVAWVLPYIPQLMSNIHIEPPQIKIPTPGQ